MNNLYLITGASSDIGVALIDRLLSNSDKSDRILAQGQANLCNLQPLQEKFPEQIITMQTDLSNPDALEPFIAEIEKYGTCPTHFVHLPALRALNTKFKNFDIDRFMLDMQVQTYSAAAICKTFAPRMAKQKNGRILFMLTSYIIGTPPKNMAAYIMAKEALHGLAKSLAVDYASFGVTVNCVAPSMIETKFLTDTPDLIVQAAAEANPMKRNATPADVVPAMAFLLGEEASYITGAVLPITGGSAL